MSRAQYLSVVCSCPPATGAVALTFDDGPSTWTPLVLDALEGAGACGTFFVVGRRLEDEEIAAPVLRRIRAGGHETGNHTYSHVDVRDLDDEELRTELRTTNELLVGRGLPRPRLFRPPMLSYGNRTRRVAAEPELGFEWLVDRTPDCDPQDWDRAHVGADEIVEIASRTTPGSIVMFHDGFPPGDDAPPTVRALPDVLERIARAGLECVTVSELINRAAGSAAPPIRSRRGR